MVCCQYVVRISREFPCRPWLTWKFQRQSCLILAKLTSRRVSDIGFPHICPGSCIKLWDWRKPLRRELEHKRFISTNAIVVCSQLPLSLEVVLLSQSMDRYTRDEI